MSVTLLRPKADLVNVELVDIQGFGKVTFTPGRQGPTLLLGDNSSGKTSLLRAIVLGMADPTTATSLLREYEGNCIRKGADQGKIVVRCD